MMSSSSLKSLSAKAEAVAKAEEWLQKRSKSIRTVTITSTETIRTIKVMPRKTNSRLRQKRSSSKLIRKYPIISNKNNMKRQNKRSNKRN